MGRSESGPGGVMSPRRFLGVVLAIVTADAITKWFAVRHLTPAYVPHDVLGESVRLTLVYNPGAAFGLHLGPWSRWIFTALTVIALVLMWRLYKTSEPGARWRVAALALVSGGAIGNLVDRLRSSRGVVDFVDIGVGDWRWPTFNVADVAVSTGALLLAVVLWHEEEVRVKRERASTG
ncbi:MAG: signal peptidase II [Gemmatimonadales bacterium]|nr:signal peptidase II [Gemmatimonadota bacterium]MCL4212809.1 signal peptidase II [Gemmatimonadales bacterium]